MTQDEERLAELLHQAAGDPAAGVSFEAVATRARRYRWLTAGAAVTAIAIVIAAAAIAGVSLSGAGGSAPASPGHGESSAWRTYRESPHGVSLSFRYPATWQAKADFVVSTGGASLADLWTGTSRAAMMTTDCAERGRALGTHGVFVGWVATLGAGPGQSSKLAFYPGQDIRVDGRTARWSVQPSTICFKGRVVTGVIQEAPRKLLIMTADVGSAVPNHEISVLRRVLNSARGGT